MPKGEDLVSLPNRHPYIRVADMTDGMIIRIQNNFMYVEDNIFSEISRYIVNSGDIIISIVGTIGKINLVDDSLDQASLTENCYKIVSTINPYIFCFLKSTIGSKKIEEGIVGGVQAKLPLYNVESIRIPLPDIGLLKDFDEQFSVISKTIKNLSEELTHLRKLQSLLTSKLA